MLSRPVAVANCFATEATVTGLNSTATSELNDADQLLTPAKDIATRLPTEVKCLLKILAICREHKHDKPPSEFKLLLHPLHCWTGEYLS